MAASVTTSIKNRHFGSVLVWSMCVYVNTMPRTKDNSISKQSEVHHATMRRYIHKWKTFKTVSSLHKSGRPTNLLQGQTMYCPNYENRREASQTP